MGDEAGCGLDPLGNWPTYAAYDPRLWHFPSGVPFIDLAPNFEPAFAFFGYYGFSVAIPLMVVELIRRVHRRSLHGSFVRRHPLWVLSATTFAVGFVLDAAVEIFMLRTGQFAYTIAQGETYQFPLLVQCTSTTIPFVVCALLLWRTGN